MTTPKLLKPALSVNEDASINERASYSETQYLIDGDLFTRTHDIKGGREEIVWYHGPDKIAFLLAGESKPEDPNGVFDRLEKLVAKG